MARATEPTDQLLRDTCAGMAQRFRWTEDFDVVMRDPVRSRMVRIAALHCAALGRSAGYVSRPAAALAARPRLGALPLFDRKRAASGERDDD